jgi:hypothetical protein
MSSSVAAVVNSVNIYYYRVKEHLSSIGWAEEISLLEHGELRFHKLVYQSVNLTTSSTCALPSSDLILCIEYST